MKEYFKKGQMVVKRLGIIDVPKKARGSVTFGCDVCVEGTKITCLGPTAGIGADHISPRKLTKSLYSLLYMANGDVVKSEPVPTLLNADAYGLRFNGKSKSYKKKLVHVIKPNVIIENGGKVNSAVLVYNHATLHFNGEIHFEKADA